MAITTLNTPSTFVNASNSSGTALTTWGSVVIGDEVFFNNYSQYSSPLPVYDAATGVKKRVLTLPASPNYNAMSIGVDESNSRLFCLNTSTQVVELNKDTGAIIQTFTGFATAPDFSSMGNFIVDFTNDLLIYPTYANATLVVKKFSTGAIIKTYTLVIYPAGVCYVGRDNLAVTCYSNNRLYFSDSILEKGIGNLTFTYQSQITPGSGTVVGCAYHHPTKRLFLPLYNSNGLVQMINVEGAILDKHLIQDGTQIKKFVPPVIFPGATWNPDDKASSVTLSNSNKTATYLSHSQNVRATLGKTAGKWYYEMKVETQNSSSFLNVGLSNKSFSVSAYFYALSAAPAWSWRAGAGVQGKVYGFELDMDAKSCKIYDGTTLVATLSNLSGEVFPTIGDDNTSGSVSMTANFVGPFVRAVPTGFSAYDTSASSTPASWQVVGSAPASKTMFDNFGMNDMSFMRDEYIRLLSSPAPELLTLTSDPTPRYSSNIITQAMVVGQSAGNAKLAFDGNTSGSYNTNWWLVSPNATFPVWVKLDLGTAKAVSKVRIMSYYTAGLEGIKDWKLLASNTGAFAGEQVTVYTGTHPNDTTTSFVDYNFVNSTAYRYYRLEVTSLWPGNGNNDLSIVEIEMCEYLGTPQKNLYLTKVPTPRLIPTNSNLNIIQEIQSFVVDADQASGIGNGVDDSVPKMTSYTSPSGTASASSEYAGWPAWFAFDDILPGAGSSYGWCNSSGTTGWLAYEFPTAQTIIKYTLMSCADSNTSHMPKTWTLEGTNDNTNWTVVHSVSGEPSWSNLQKRSYTVTSPSAYKKYRLNVTASQSGSYVVVGEMELIGAPGTGYVRFLLSGDNGNTWKAINGVGEIVTVPFDLASAKAQGMSATQMNSLTRQQIYSIAPTGRMRLAIYLEQGTAADIAAVRRLDSIENLYVAHMTVDSMWVNYNAVDKNYYGLMFMDETDQYYSTSLGEILQYLDFGGLIAGQTSLDVKVKLMNTMTFPVNNIQLWPSHSLEEITVELSKTNNPFDSEELLLFEETVEPDEFIEFYIRLSATRQAKVGGTFDIRAKAEPVQT